MGTMVKNAQMFPLTFEKKKTDAVSSKLKVDFIGRT